MTAKRRYDTVWGYLGALGHAEGSPGLYEVGQDER
jgi:hypothetical protein